MRLTARIRAELEKGPASSTDIARRLGEPMRKVSALLSQLVHRTGDVLVYDHKPTRYVTRAWVRPQPWKADRPEPRLLSDEWRMAGKITIGRGLTGWH